MRGFSQGFDGFQSGDEAPLPEPRIAIVLWLTLSPICRTADHEHVGRKGTQIPGSSSVSLDR